MRRSSMLLGCSVLAMATFSMLAACANSADEPLVAQEQNQTETQESVKVPPPANTTNNTTSSSGETSTSSSGGSSGTSTSSSSSSTSSSSSSGGSTSSTSSSGGAGVQCDMNNPNPFWVIELAMQSSPVPCPCGTGKCCYGGITCLTQ